MMNTKTLPELPSSERAWPVYLQAVATILPALVLWFISDVFLIPKLQYIWQIAGLTNSSAQWVMDGSYLLIHHMRFIFVAVCLLCIALEARCLAWTHYRRAVVVTVTAIFNTTVLVGITAIAIAVLIAAPSLVKKAPSSHADVRIEHGAGRLLSPRLLQSSNSV